MTFEAVDTGSAEVLMIDRAAPGSASTGRRDSAADALRRHDRGRRQDLVAYRVIFVAAFVIFLVALIIERAMPWHWSSRSGAARSKSIFEEAREAASIGAGYAFMG